VALPSPPESAPPLLLPELLLLAPLLLPPLELPLLDDPPPLDELPPSTPLPPSPPEEPFLKPLQAPADPTSSVTTAAGPTARTDIHRRIAGQA
jgi:hypothetical protein